MFIRKKTFSYVACVVLLVGIIFRVILYVQNRNLIIDEANIARNIAERNFLSLLEPLSYEQYAPPLFLWITKLNTVFFGASEYALRLYPLACGVTGLILLYLLLKKYAADTAAWYPLFLMATGWIYVRYATEVKQYSSDVVVTLGILLLTLRMKTEDIRPLKFTLIWLLIGSLAIWLSMPSVFMLAGLGVYYFVETISGRNYKHMIGLLVSGFAWLVQFYFYYKSILEPQAHSSFLQNSHKGSFLILLPKNAEEWSYNMESLSSLFFSMGGKWAISAIPHIVLLFIALVVMAKRKWSELALFIVPIVGLLIAAGLHDFSLLPRVSLFIMPLLLLLIGIGLNYLLQTRLFPLKIVFLACCFITMFNFNELRHINRPMEFERITKAYKWIEQRNTNASIWIHDLARPQNIYYTSIHPGRDKWRFMKQAHYFYWNTDMDSLCRQAYGKNFFIYSWPEDWDWKRSSDVFPTYFTIIDSMVNETNRTYYFERNKIAGINPAILNR